MSLGDRDSHYEDFETNNLLKAEKGKIEDTHSHDLSALLKNSAESNNDGKGPIPNNNGVINTPTKVPCCQNPVKSVYDIEVDLEIPNQVDQEKQIPQNSGDTIS